jgi:predicted polyphosphate/ATP-dependent NAD kinase
MKIGFLINPIAGMGGRVGLKGTDDVVEEAIRRGARPVAPDRARDFLRTLRQLVDRFKVSLDIVACKLTMGEDILNGFDFSTKYIDIPLSRETTADDTKSAICRFIDMGVDVIVFVGGDGTARDIYDALNRCGGLDIPILGVPSGVKIYSGVFAVTPGDAAHVLVDYVLGRARTMELEIMDIDEEAFRHDIIDIRLYGYAKAIYEPFHIQYSKQVSPDSVDEAENQEAIARTVLEEWDRDGIYILGPGTTVKKVADLLGLKKTLLGVDVYYKGRMYNDLSESEILKLIGDEDAWIIVTPIGRQGILFGRGNQQISPRVIKRVGKDRIIVLATLRKLRDIPEGVLRVDTQDPDVDMLLKGYIKVIVDYRTWRMVKIV